MESTRGTRIRTERRDLDHAVHARLPAGGEERPGRLVVDGIETPLATLPQDPDGIDHRIDPVEPSPPGVRIDIPRIVHGDLVRSAHRPMHASADRMSGRLQCDLQMATEETIGPEEQHVHAPFLDCKTT